VTVVADAETIDDYELVNCIATGNSTQIWEVKQAGSAQSLAMKLLLDEAFKDPEQKKILKTEGTLGKSLEHPNIIRIFNVKFTRKHGYFTMEHFRSSNLKVLIRNDLPTAQSKAKKLMECLTQAVGYMHEKGWLHRDIKPENVLMNKGGEVRLIDFSLASKPSNALARAVTKKKNIVIQGTRTYLAPELIRREALTFAADMYSLGILFYEVLVGHPPFRTARPNDLLMMHIQDKPVTPSDLDDNITPEVDQLIHRMLAKKPKDRPGNMQELFAEIRSLKFFKDDPIAVHKARKEAELTTGSLVEDARLDSRMDAMRSAEGGGPARKPVPKPAPKPAPKPVEKPAAQTPAAQQPQQTPPPQPYPGYPGMGYPGMPMQPGMPMPGFPPQPGMPMMPFPGYPGMPPGQFPGYPGMPSPAAPPGHGPPQPAGPAPGSPQQGPPQPTPPPQAAPQPNPAVPRPSAPQVEDQAVEEDLPVANLDDLEIE
jgi:eukaryotic-like serine/threonine-protein kinase